MIHSTTRFSISQLLYGSSFKNIAERFYTREEMNQMIMQYREQNNEGDRLENKE